MPGNPRECILHAVKCIELAAGSKNRSIKDNYLALAATWQALANQLEIARALAETIDEETVDRRRLPGSATAVRADTGC